MSVEERLAAALERALEPVRPRPGAWARLRSQLEESPPVPLWHRVWARGVSRRQFLGGAAAAAAAAFVPAPPLGETSALPQPEPPPPWDRWAPPRPGHGSIWHYPPRVRGKPANPPVFRPPTPDEHDLYMPGVGFRSLGGMRRQYYQQR